MIADILVKIYILSKVKSIAWEFSLWGAIPVFLSITLYLIGKAAEADITDNSEKIMQYVLRIFLPLWFVFILTSTLIPSKEELMVYYGAKQVTVQNYEKAKSEIIDFTKEIKKAITDKEEE